jgi:decaprenylphospho-beta-D-ribofuranose 2-oxidase
VARTELTGWGLYPRSQANLVEPDTVAGIRRALDAHGTIARGLGRSYGDAAMNDGRTVLGLTHFDRVLAFDETTGVVRCEAGVSLSQLIERFAPKGWFPLVTPGTRFVTVGGCIANDVHGKAHHVQGSFLESVHALTLMLASGEVVTASRTENAELFLGCFGGMGLLGVVLDATLQLRKVTTTYFRQSAFVADSLSALLDVMDQNDATFPYSVATIDPLATGAQLGRGVLTVGDHAQLEDLPAALRHEPLRPGGSAVVDVPFVLPQFTINPVTLKALHAVIKQVLSRAAPIVHADQFFYPLDALTNWNRGYGRRGFTQYQLVIPRVDGARRLGELLKTIVAASELPTLNVLKRLGAANQAPLSFPMDGYTLAIDFPIRQGTRALTQRLDAMVADFGGRVYLGKDAFLDAPTFERMYPHLQAWRRLKATLDPRTVFQSDLSRRVGLTSP